MIKLLLYFAMIATMSGCAPRGMIAKGDCPNAFTIKPPEGKSALVIAQSANNRAIVSIDNFIDGKYIGSNRAHSMFITYVDPGTYYVSSKGTLLKGYHTVKIDLKSGQTYFIQNEISVGLFNTRPDFDIVDAKHLINDMEDKCRLFAVDTKNPEDNINEDDYKEILSEFSTK